MKTGKAADRTSFDYHPLSRPTHFARFSVQPFVSNCNVHNDVVGGGGYLKLAGANYCANMTQSLTGLRKYVVLKFILTSIRSDGL